MIYILNIHPNVSLSSGKGFVSSENRLFYLSSSDEVCEILSKVPKEHFVSLSICDFNSIDDVLNYLKNGCCSVESFRD